MSEQPVPSWSKVLRLLFGRLVLLALIGCLFQYVLIPIFGPFFQSILQWIEGIFYFVLFIIALLILKFLDNRIPKPRTRFIATLPNCVITFDGDPHTDTAQIAKKFTDILQVNPDANLHNYEETFDIKIIFVEKPEKTPSLPPKVIKGFYT